MFRHTCMTRSILKPRSADNKRQEVKKIINNNLFLIKTNNLVIEIFVYYK
jgi:hypothetical protein